jgi:hypothetical protein
MNKKTSSLLLLLIVLTLYSFKEPKYGKLSNKILHGYSAELKKKGIMLVGEGGAMMGDIQSVFMHYFVPGEFSLNDARKMYVEVAEEYIKRYNDDEKIRPYLHNYPFNISNIELEISFKDEKGNPQENGYVAYISRSNKNLVYYAEYKNNEYVTLHKEPYAEAVAIVKGQK